MENFLKEMSEFPTPEFTPDSTPKRRLPPNGVQSKPQNEGSPLIRELAASIPKGEEGIDMSEFETYECYVEKVTTV